MSVTSAARLGIVSVALLAAASAVPAASVGVEEFTLGENGWDGNTTSATVVHIASGGNPGGFIEARKDLSPPAFDIGASTHNASVTGDFAGIGGVSVDLRFVAGSFTDAWVRLRRNSGENGWLHPLAALFPENLWNTYSAPIDATWTDLQARAAGWITDQDINPLAAASPSWSTVMAGVGETEVRLASMGSTLVDIDNFRLTAIPEPTTAAALVAAFLLRRRPRRL